MYISKDNQISFTVFIATLSALAPGFSNLPITVIPCLIFIFLDLVSDRNLINEKSFILIPKKFFYISWLVFFLIYLILCFINILFISTPNAANESFLFALIYLIYIIFFSKFSFNELIKGIIKGSFPMFFYMVIIEFPLRIINPEFLNKFLRPLLNLRNTNEFVLRGFFEESSHMPSLFILLIASLVYLIVKKYKKLFLEKKDLVFFIMLIFSLSSISGSLLLSFYLPLFVFFLMKFIYKLINGKILLIDELKLLVIAFLSSLFFSYREVIIYKFQDALNFGHSMAVRSFGLLGSIYDIFSNPILGVGAGLYRLTRESSVLGFINIFSFNEQIYELLMYGYTLANYGFDSPVRGKFFPIYSTTGYLLSETGIFFLLFFIPYLSIILKGFRVAWQGLNNFNIINIDKLIFGLLPLSYLIYFTTAYPRMLPYFIIAIILVEKYIAEIEYKSFINKK